MILTFLFNNVFYNHYVYKIKLNQTQKTKSFEGYILGKEARKIWTNFLLIKKVNQA